MNGSKKGFTLIETVIAVAIFTLIIIMATNIFVSAIKGQRKSFGLQNVQENTRYALEMMAKEIRMATINSPAGLVSTLDITAHKPDGDKSILYWLSGGQIIRSEGGNPATITSIKVDVIRLQFYIEGGGATQIQPRVTIVAQIQSQGIQVEEQAQINLQTTVVSRTY